MNIANLELKWYKDVSVESKCLIVLKLPRCFTHNTCWHHRSKNFMASFVRMICLFKIWRFFLSFYYWLCGYYTAPQKNESTLLHTYVRNNFWQPTARVQQYFFEKALIEVGSSHLYASFGTFYVQIDQSAEA